MLRLRCILVFLLLGAFGSVVALAAANQETIRPIDRITTAIDDNQLVQLPKQVHRLALPKYDRGAVSPDLAMERMILLLSPTGEQETQLQQFLADVQNPKSSLYHRWLTAEEYGLRFGASQKDVETVTAWLSGRGFRVNKAARNRLMIEFSGTAAEVNAAFHTQIHAFDVAGATHYANAYAPSIPAALAPVVKGLVSLHNFPRVPLHRMAQAAVPVQQNAQRRPEINLSNGSHAMTPYDFATIYNVAPLWSKGIDGTGQSIAIVGRAWVDLSEVAAFRNLFGLPQNQPTIVYTGGTLEQGNGEVLEAELDIQWSGAVAKGANIIYVQSGSTNTADGVDLSAFYAVEENVAPIVSVSFGSCEQTSGGDLFYKYLWSQAAAQGISVFVAAGDNGSAGCDDPWSNTPATGGLAVNALASTPDNVAVGGTQFTDTANPSLYWRATNDSNLASALSYIPETVWNESSHTVSSTSLAAGSGGVSTIFSTPVWQTGRGVPATDPGTTNQHHRYLPDVSLNSAGHTPYVVCMPGTCFGQSMTIYLVYGTSASSPAFAGIQALINQQAGSIQGNPNFHLYPLSSVAGTYHDVTTGNNAVPCTGGTGCSSGSMSKYSAAPGFDLATGWGSVDVNALVSNWSRVSFTPTTTTGSVTPTTFQHGTPATLSVSVKADTGTPTGAVAAYVVNGKTSELGAATLANGSASGDANGFPGGDGTLYFRYGGDGIYGSSTSEGIPVAVTPEPSRITVAPPPTNPAAGDGFYFTVSVAGESRVGVATGSVKAQVGGKDAGSNILNGGETSVPISFPPYAPGTYTYSISYGGDSSFSPSSTNVDVTIGKANTTTLTFCTGTALFGTDIKCSYQTIYMVGSGPTGTIQFYDRGVAIGSTLPVNYVQQVANLGKLSTGTHVITAVYSGSDFYNSSASSAATVNVVATGTLSASLSVFGYSVKPGSPVQVNAYAIPGQEGPNLDGTLTLLDGATPIGTYVAQGDMRSISPGFTLNTAANPMSVGDHILSVKYSGDSHWPDATSSTHTLQISNPDFSITGLDPVTVSRGSTGFFYATVRGLGGLYGQVSLTCTGAPAQATCSIQSPVTTGSTPSVTITTTAPHTVSASRTTSPWIHFGGVFAFGLLMLGVPGARRGRKVVISSTMLLVIALAVSCGGGGTSGPPAKSTITDPGTPVGTYTLTITGTYGTGDTAITHSYPLQLTVK